MLILLDSLFQQNLTMLDAWEAVIQFQTCPVWLITRQLGLTQQFYFCNNRCILFCWIRLEQNWTSEFQHSLKICKTQGRGIFSRHDHLLTLQTYGILFSSDIIFSVWDSFNRENIDCKLEVLHVWVHQCFQSLGVYNNHVSKN